MVEGGAEASEEAMRRPFAVLAFVFAAFSCVLSNVGLDVILMFSVPMLNALYPVAIVLVLMGLVHGFCDAHRRCGSGSAACRGAERDYLGPRCVLYGRVAAVRCAAAGRHWSRVGAGCRGGVCDRPAPQSVCRTFEELGYRRLHRRGVSPIISFALGHARFRP